MTEHTRHNDRVLEDHIEKEEKQFDAIELRLQNVEVVVNELKDIMVQAKGAVTFLKIMAGLVAMAAAIYTYVHEHFSVALK